MPSYVYVDDNLRSALQDTQQKIDFLLTKYKEDRLYTEEAQAFIREVENNPESSTSQNLPVCTEIEIADDADCATVLTTMQKCRLGLMRYVTFLNVTIEDEEATLSTSELLLDDFTELRDHCLTKARYDMEAYFQIHNQTFDVDPVDPGKVVSQEYKDYRSQGTNEQYQCDYLVLFQCRRYVAAADSVAKLMC